MLIAGDIGGTKTDLTTYSRECGPHVSLAQGQLPSPDYPSLQAMVATFLSEAKISVDSASFGPDLRNNLRTVVLLREFQGLTNKETAQRLGLTMAAVKARIFHARRWLRRRLERKLKPTGNGSRIDM